MKIEPKIENRNEQNYAAIKAETLREKIDDNLVPLISEITEWLKKENIEPAGPPFFSYLKMNGEKIQVEVGFPLNSKITGDGRVYAGKFPGGSYAKAVYKGHFSNLFKAHTEIEKWKDKNGVKFKLPKIEFYLTDPNVEPDSEKWKTVILNKIDD